MSELKPCPFCGGEAWMRISDAPQILRIECRECHAATTSFVADSIGEKEAAAAWNTRHVETVETCRNVDADQGWFGCSECGCICSVDWYGAGFGTPNFCPNCGRKVE